MSRDKDTTPIRAPAEFHIAQRNEQTSGLLGNE